MADDSDTGSTEPSSERQPARTRTALTDISSRAWEHPADKGALVALRKLKGFDTLLKAMSGLINERSVRLLLLGSAVRADERNFARLAPAARRCRFRPRRRGPARALRPGQPDVQRLHDRPEHPDHRRRLRARRPSRRRRGDALPARPRARARPERARRLPDPPAPPARPDGGPVRRPGRRPGRAGHHRSAVGVVAQGRAVGRPRRPACGPEPGRCHQGAHEAGLRRRPATTSTPRRSSRRAASTPRPRTSATPS